jgi:hypothetical protein
MQLRTTIVKGFVKALAAAAIAASPALAQSADPIDNATRGAAPSGEPARELRVPEAPATPAPQPQPMNELAKEIGQKPIPATDASGSAVGGAGGGTASPQAAPTGAPSAASPAGPGGPAGGAEPEDHSTEINGNYDATLAIYQSILDKQGTDPANLDRRIQSNEEMIAKYRPMLVNSENELRKIQVDFMNHAFQLKQQKETGQITEDMFGKMIQQEEMKHGRRRDSLVQDTAFYKDEITQAEIRLKDLKEQRRQVADRAAREGRNAAPKKKPGEALFQGLSGTLEKLSGFQTRFTMDGNAHCRQCNDFPRTAPPAAAQGAEGEAAKDKE